MRKQNLQGNQPAWKIRRDRKLYLLPQNRIPAAKDRRSSQLHFTCISLSLELYTSWMPDVAHLKNRRMKTTRWLVTIWHGMGSEMVPCSFQDCVFTCIHWDQQSLNLAPHIQVGFHRQRSASPGPIESLKQLNQPRHVQCAAGSPNRSPLWKGNMIRIYIYIYLHIIDIILHR